MKSAQTDMFGLMPKFPEGFRYEADVLSREEEAVLLVEIAELPFAEFHFQGFVGKRRTVSYGWHYDFNERALKTATPMPDFLASLRDKAARFAAVPAEALQQVLVTEYADGAGIGWHRDKGVYGDVIGISLRTSCTFRLRRRVGDTWERVSLIAEPRSMYLLRGPSRSEWEHSIPGVHELRYSITFRNFRD